jgi:hypothetical protein
MYDVDRNRYIYIHDVCSDYSDKSVAVIKRVNRTLNDTFVRASNESFIGTFNKSFIGSSNHSVAGLFNKSIVGFSNESMVEIDENDGNPLEMLAPIKLNLPTFVPRRMLFLTLADIPDRPGICLVGTAVAQVGGILQVLAWNHSTTFFDGTSCGAQCKANFQKDLRVGQQKKTHWLHHYFEKYSLNDDDLVLLTDAWDVVIQASLEQLPALFLKHTKGQRGVIFNSETVCGDSFAIWGSYGDHLRKSLVDVQLGENDTIRKVRGSEMCNEIKKKSELSSIGTGPNVYLGSGGFLGDVKTVRALLRRVKQVHSKQQSLYERGVVPFPYYGDQISFQIAYVMYPELNVKVDRNGEIFFVTSDGVMDNSFEHFNMREGCNDDYFANETGSVLSWSESIPIFVHFPGGHKGKYAKCAEPVVKSLQKKAHGKRMYDVDRNRYIYIHDVCSDFT